MIILRLIGGLGNQLFIYAFGRALELNHNLEVYFDIYSGFKNDPYKRKYELDNFKTIIKKSSFYDSMFFPLHKRSKLLAKFLFPDCVYVVEDKYFSIEQLKTKSSQYKKNFLEDYFQKAEYFENIKSELKKEIILNKELSETANNYLEIIKKNNSVAVHIRLKERANGNQLDVYSDNISRLKKELNNPVFFIFSDDISWCKKNMQLDTDIILIEKSNNHIEDFWLMKNCNHFIITNSTFSWWAAWLAPNNNKIIMQPKFDEIVGKH